MRHFRALLIAFCRLRVERLGRAQGRWLNFAYWLENGEAFDIPEYHEPLK